LSNLIKSHYIFFDKGEKRIIDSNTKPNNYQPISFERDEFETDSTDVEGIPQNKIEQLVMEETELMHERANILLEDALKKSSEIIENAKIESYKERENILANAKEEGYQEGYQVGLEEVKKLQEKLEDDIYQQQLNYEKQMASLEPKFAGIMISLIEKITGVVMEDHKDIILHLVKNSLNNLNNNMNFLIKVSKEDFNAVYTRRNDFLAELREGARIEIFEDQSLEKNQCMIETDNSIIDCSLDVQLNSLLTNLKLLANI
jgi:flagellar assembly protein FliH